MSVKEPASRRIQSVDRAVALLRAVAAAPGPTPLADLADSVGLNRSTAWRLLLTLEHHGLVDRDGATGGFVLGYEVGRLASRSGSASLVRRVGRSGRKLVRVRPWPAAGLAYFSTWAQERCMDAIVTLLNGNATKNNEKVVY